MKHPADAALNDYADGLLDRAGEAAVAAHLAECPACRERVAAIRTLEQRLAALPRDIPPPHDLRPPVPGRRPARRRWLEAAAAVALLAAGAILARGGGDVPARAQGPAPIPTESYAEATRDLRAVVEGGRPDLDPATARLVERNLAAVDRAIAELETARSGRPDDPALARLLDRQYRTRLELLRAAVALLTEAHG